jgi:hypothetical protein
VGPRAASRHHFDAPRIARTRPAFRPYARCFPIGTSRDSGATPHSRDARLPPRRICDERVRVEAVDDGHHLVEVRPLHHRVHDLDAPLAAEPRLLGDAVAALAQPLGELDAAVARDDTNLPVA